MNIERTLYTITEVCELLRISRAFLYKEWSKGRGPARINIGARTLIKVDSLHTWLSSIEKLSGIYKGELPVRYGASSRRPHSEKTAEPFKTQNLRSIHIVGPSTRLRNFNSRNGFITFETEHKTQSAEP